MIANLITPTLLAMFLATFVGCATTPEPSASLPSAHAVIQSVDGRAHVSFHGGRWQSARAGQVLRQGDLAKTSPTGKINLNLGDYGGFVSLMPESYIEFEQLGPIAPNSNVVAVLRLTQGRILGDTLELPPNTKIIIKTLGGTHEIP